ncbi:MAG: DUF3037 domain-containing protein [Cypionkella sp.]|nr:DUF3037 domain-containing protein [Cypionkella sp.]
MKKFPFTFSILQYEHNPWLKERLNVGVLLFSAEGQFLKIKKRGSRGRISRAYARI